MKSEVTGGAGPGTRHRFWKVSGTVGAPCARACQCQCWCTALTAQDAGDLADTVLPLTLWLLPSRFSRVWLFATPWTVPARLLCPWIRQAILEWAAISCSRGSSRPRDRTWVSWGSCIADRFLITWVPWGSFPGGSDGKASAYNAGDLGSIPGSGRSPGEENGNPLQHSCLENPVDGGAW